MKPLCLANFFHSNVCCLFFSRYVLPTMGDAVLGRTTLEKDLGVPFSGDMKVSEQCGIAA